MSDTIKEGRTTRNGTNRSGTRKSFNNGDTPNEKVRARGNINEGGWNPARVVSDEIDRLEDAFEKTRSSSRVVSLLRSARAQENVINNELNEPGNEEFRKDLITARRRLRQFIRRMQTEEKL